MSEDIKTVKDEEVKELELPELTLWGSIAGRPKSLMDLNITDGQRLNMLDIFSDQDTTAIPSGFQVLSSGINTSEDGTISAYVVLSWDDNTEGRFDSYEIRYKRSDFTYYNYISTKETTITIEGLLPNQEYEFGIASVNKYGIKSNYSVNIEYTTATSTISPATVQGVSATGGIQYAIIEWDSNTELDLASYNIYRNTTNNSSTASLIANVRTNYFVNGNLTGYTTYYYWVKAVNTSRLESTEFSTVASATPRNVGTTDVEVIAADKILIDGVVYLSNWRKSGDITKIDGGSISTNTITTTQLNFTPVQSTDVIAKINASEEGLEITADRITINGKSYFTSETGARVEIFPDTNTGIRVIDNGDNEVFKTIIGGTHVGDVYMGNYSGNQGIFYDKSANTTTFRGRINADDIYAGTIYASNIGSDLTDANISSINFNNITASNISADSITAGTLTGRTVQTSSTGSRVVMHGTDNAIKLYDSSGYQRMQLSGQYLSFAGPSATDGVELYASGYRQLTIRTPVTSVAFDVTGFYPTSGSSDLGTTSSRWGNIYGNYIKSYGNIDAVGDISARDISARDIYVDRQLILTPRTTSNAVKGSIMFFSTDNTLRVYDGTAWRKVNWT